MTSMPCLIMQYKPYIVELPLTKESYNKKYVAIALLALIHLINSLTILILITLQTSVSSFRV